jgi:Flp pilus assembly protein TadG
MAAVELALGWSVLFLLFSGVYQFGYAFYTYNALVSSVANAAELGSKMDYDTANPSTFTTNLQNMVVYGDETAGVKPIVPGLKANNVNVTVTFSNAIPIDITIAITGYQVSAIFNTFSFNGKPRATTAYLGHLTCSTC